MAVMVSAVIRSPTKELTSFPTTAAMEREGDDDHNHNNASDNEEELHDEAKGDEMLRMMDALRNIMV